MHPRLIIPALDGELLTLLFFIPTYVFKFLFLISTQLSAWLMVDP